MNPEKKRKGTSHIPQKLLSEAQAITGLGITETIKIGLEKIVHTHSYEALLNMQGKIKLSVDIDDLRSGKE